MKLAQVLVNGVTLGGMLALMSVGLTLVFGILRIVNFAHGELFMIGAYSSYYLTKGLGIPYLATVALSPFLVALVGALLYVVVLDRFRGNLLGGAISTIATGALLQAVAWKVVGVTPKFVTSPLRTVIDLGPASVLLQRLLVAGIGVAVMLLLHIYTSSTRMGRATRAVEQDSRAAALQGINVRAVSAFAFALGAAMAGLAGVLMAPLSTLSPTMGVNPLLTSFVVVIVGGIGSVAGAIAASFIVAIELSFVGTYWSGPGSVLVSFAVAFVILSLRPTGLFGAGVS